MFNKETIDSKLNYSFKSKIFRTLKISLVIILTLAILLSITSEGLTLKNITLTYAKTRDVQKLTDTRVEYTEDIGFDFYKILPKPIAKNNGRGEAIEHLVSNYGNSYVDDPLLGEDVIRFRRWEWYDLYESLDKKAEENPDTLDIYRLQAEIYLVNKKYEEAFSQLDIILRKEPTDIHALSLSILAAKVTGNEEQYESRLKALNYVSPEAYKEVSSIFEFTELNNYEHVDYGAKQLTNMEPDVIAVFGQSPNSDGSPSEGLLSRLEKVKEMAEKYPEIPIVLSGGPVRYEHAEADVMAKWLIENGIDKDRIILDLLARDTPGNAIGMIKEFKRLNAHNALVVATILHLPRATTVLKLYGKTIGYEMNIDCVGGGYPPSKTPRENERLYTYVNAMRASNLYTKNDFNKFANNNFTNLLIENKEYLILGITLIIIVLYALTKAKHNNKEHF